MTAQNGYANIHGWELYDTTGTTEDWSYNATGGYGYTFEIGPNEFHPPFAQVVDEYLGAGAYAGKGNREAYLMAFEEAVDRGQPRRDLRQGARRRHPAAAQAVLHPDVEPGERLHGLARELDDHQQPDVQLGRQPVDPSGSAGSTRQDPRRGADPQRDLHRHGSARPARSTTSSS